MLTETQYILHHLNNPRSLNDPEFIAWLHEDQHAAIFHKVCCEREAFLRYTDQGNIDVEKEYDLFLKKIDNRPQNSWKWKVAAACILLFGSILLLTKQTGETLATDTELTGKKGAELILADGRRIILQSENIRLTEKNGTLIINDTATGLAYQPDTAQATDQDIKYHLLKVPSGADYMVCLSDGTRVRLNCGTEFHYPVQFAGQERKVYLKGEAFFEVQKAEQWPFIVETDQMYVKVTGTQFDVRAYPAENCLLATLVSGKVVAGQNNNPGQTVELRPNEQYYLDKTTGQQQIRKVDTQLYTAWTQGMFVFKNTKLEEVMNTLAQWYDIEVFYLNADVKELHISAYLGRYEHIDDILDIIQAMNKVKVERKEKTIVFSWK